MKQEINSILIFIFHLKKKKIRSNFIKLSKSKQLVYSVFREDKNLDYIARFTKECIADDLAKPYYNFIINFN